MTPSGFTIPILASIGNHETGGDRTGADAVFYFLDYFPYYDSSFENDDYLSVPRDERRHNSLFHSHGFGNLIQFIVLDSGHAITRSSQRGWLTETLQNSTDFHYRFALYHAPLYPGRRGYHEKSPTDARLQWGSLFDQYKLTMYVFLNSNLFFNFLMNFFVQRFRKP